MSEEGLEQKYVKEAFDTNWVVTMGPNVNAFEQDLAAFANKVLDGNDNEDEDKLRTKTKTKTKTGLARMAERLL